MIQFIPATRNINMGTERGLEMIEHSMRSHGAARSGVAARDGEMIAGSHSLQVAEELSLPIREVHTNGNEYVIVVRDDIESARTEMAKMLALSDNISAQAGSRIDTEVMTVEYEIPGLRMDPFLLVSELSDIYEKEEKREKREEREDAKPIKEPVFSSIMARVKTATKQRWSTLIEAQPGETLSDKVETIIDKAEKYDALFRWAP